MRTHRKYSYLSSWIGGEQLKGVARLPNLVSARLEPIVRGLRGGALLDLVFCSGMRVAVIPCIEVVPEMLAQREMSAFVWPHEPVSLLDLEDVDEIERALLPWIESLTLARQLNAEASQHFGGEDARDLISSARSAGFLGATPYGELLRDAAPYLYAVRFAENRTIAARDARGALGAVVLGKYAREVRADLGEASRNEFAARWYGAALFGSLTSDTAAEIGIFDGKSQAIDAPVRIALDAKIDGDTVVRVATPVPTDVMVSFDPADAPACRLFSVHVASTRPLRETAIMDVPVAAGGSSGRVLMVMRDDYLRAPDSDVDEAAALADLLRAEGFTVELSAASSALSAAYDLVHVFGLARVNELENALSAAQANRVPVVLSPYFQDVSAQGAWGTGVVRALLRVSTDETDLEDNLALLEQRRLEGPGLSAKRQEPFAGFDDAVRRALQRAGAVIVSGAEEERRLRAFGYGGPAIAAGACIAANRGSSADAWSGNGDFVFAHTPVESRANLLPLVRAATSADVPLLVAGHVVEPEYALALKEQAGARIWFIPEPEPAVAEALYRTARVYADLSWIQGGRHRAIRAYACGAALLVPQGSYIREILPGEAVSEADPASEPAIARGLALAWSAAAKERPLLLQAGNPRDALVATVQAYAAAQRAIVHA